MLYGYRFASVSLFDNVTVDKEYAISGNVATIEKANQIC